MAKNKFKMLAKRKHDATMQIRQLAQNETVAC